MRQLALAFLVVLWSAGAGFAQPRPAAPRAAPPPSVAGQADVAPASAPAALSLEQQEHFLSKAKLTKTKGAKKGVTGTTRATMSDGTTTHDASIQTIDVASARFETNRGTELNFRDYWGYNVAAYRLGVMLGLDNIPPSVKRRFKTKEGSFTWWIDDVLMDEQGRSESNTTPPDQKYWQAQNDQIRVFDALIANVDRNQGNLLIDKQWKVWMIDHTRAFRLTDEPKNLRALLRCEKTLFASMKALDAASLKAQLDDYLSGFEITAILKRRDAIVARIESLGPAALYDLKRPAAVRLRADTK